MNTEELVAYISTNDTDDDANDLLYCLNINAEARFNKACKMLENLLKDIQKTYPDARYVAYDTNLSLFLGETHTQEKQEFDSVPKPSIKNMCLIADEYYMDDFYMNKEY